LPHAGEHLLKAVTSLVLAALLGGAAPTRAADRITFAIPAEIVQLLPIYIAQDQGFWRDAGFDATIVTIPGVGGLNAVIAGSADFSFSTGSAITRAVAHGQKIVAIVRSSPSSNSAIRAAKSWSCVKTSPTRRVSTKTRLSRRALKS
jgi:ABC-type nitrate/sulfonate/bicarbonate transport system substrate-binding protein